jgi:II/X family phage/plasmid replication protein
MVLYCKADEIELRGRALADDMPCKEAMLDWVDDKLRAEIRLRTTELGRLGLRMGAGWSEARAGEVFRDYFSKLDIGEAVMVPIESEEALKPTLRLVYDAWKRGEDLRSLLPRPTFYRHRKALYELIGIDIGVLQPKGVVIPLKRVLTAIPADVPSWAGNTFWRRSVA